MISSTWCYGEAKALFALDSAPSSLLSSSVRLRATRVICLRPAGLLCHGVRPMLPGVDAVPRAPLRGAAEHNGALPSGHHGHVHRTGAAGELAGAILLYYELILRVCLFSVLARVYRHPFCDGRSIARGVQTINAAVFIAQGLRCPR